MKAAAPRSSTAKVSSSTYCLTPARDPAALVVAGLRKRIPGNAPGHKIDGVDISRVSPCRSSRFIDEGPRLGNHLAPPVGGGWSGMLTLTVPMGGWWEPNLSHDGR